jgi:hypothetical protein
LAQLVERADAGGGDGPLCADRRLDVGRGQFVEVDARGRYQRGDPRGLRFAGALENSPRRPGIGEVRRRASPLKEVPQDLIDVRRQAQTVGPRHRMRDGNQIGGRIAVEWNGLGEARGQAGVARQKFAHRVRIAGDDDDQPIPLVFHFFQQGVYRLSAEVVSRAAVLDQRVSFVDKKDTIQRIGNLLPGLQRRLPDEARDQSRPICLDQMAFLKHAEIAQDGAVKAGHRRFAGTGRPGEDHVQRDGGRGQTLLLPGRFDLQAVDQGVDLGFDRVQPGHLGQFVQRADAGGRSIHHAQFGPKPYLPVAAGAADHPWP